MDEIQQEVVVEPTSRQCRNCENVFVGNFCNECGQEFRDETLTLKTFLFGLWRDFSRHALVFFHTCWALIRNPKQLVDDVLGGRRKQYYNGLNYFLFIGSLATFVTLQFNTMDPEATMKFWQETYENMGIDTSNQHENTILVMDWLRRHYNLMLLLFLPMWALASFWIFRKKGYSYGEQLMIALYTYGFLNLISLPIVAVTDYSDPVSKSSLVNFLIMIVWFTWIHRSLYKLSWIRSLLTALLGYILFMVINVGSIIGMTVIITLIVVIVVLSWKALTG